MNEKSKKMLFIIAEIMLVVCTIVFLCLSIFTESKNNTYLNIALACTLLFNVINLIRLRKGKRNQ